MEKKIGEDYTPIFKRGIVQLYESGESKSNIAREHNIDESLIDDWVAKYGNMAFKNTEVTYIKNEVNRLRTEQEDLKVKNAALKERTGCIIGCIIFGFLALGSLLFL